MYTGGTLCVFGRADRGENRGDRRTDILPHDDGKGHAEGNLSCRGERLQNTDGRRRRLDKRRDACTDEHTEQRNVAHRSKGRGKLRQLRERLNGRFHRKHTSKEDTEPNENGAYIAGLVAFGRHNQRIPTIQANGASVVGLRKRKKVGGIEIGQAQDMSCNRGTDVSAMITPMALRSLRTRALTRPTTITVVAEGGLDGSGNKRAEQHALDHRIRQLLKRSFQTAAGGFQDRCQAVSYHKGTLPGRLTY